MFLYTVSKEFSWLSVPEIWFGLPVHIFFPFPFFKNVILHTLNVYLLNEIFVLWNILSFREAHC